MTLDKVHETFMSYARIVRDRDDMLSCNGAVRRLVSTAYYALFQTIVDHSISLLPGASTDHERNEFGRDHKHVHVAMVCNHLLGNPVVKKQRLSPEAKAKLNRVFPAEVTDIAALFIRLYKARHDADYNRLGLFTPHDAKKFVRDVEKRRSSFRDLIDGKDRSAKAFMAAIAIEVKLDPNKVR